MGGKCIAGTFALDVTADEGADDGIVRHGKAMPAFGPPRRGDAAQAEEISVVGGAWDGEQLFVADVEMDKPTQPVTALSNALHHKEYKGQDEFLVGRWAIDIEDFELSPDDCEWAEQEFNNGNLKVVSRVDL